MVRLGPARLAVSDKDIMKQVLVTEDLKKGPVYDIFSSKCFFFSKEKRETKIAMYQDMNMSFFSNRKQRHLFV